MTNEAGGNEWTSLIDDIGQEEGRLSRPHPEKGSGWGPMTLWDVEQGPLSSYQHSTSTINIVGRHGLGYSGPKK